MDIVLFVFLGIIILFSVLNCSVRGLKRSLVRLLFVLLAGWLTLFIAPAAGGLIADRMPLWVIEEGSAPEVLASFSPTFSAAVHGVSGAIFSMLVYPFVFLLLCIIMTIPVSVINRKTERTHKGAGALAGILVGIIGFSIAFAPLCAAGTMVFDVYPKAAILEDLDFTEINGLYGLSFDAEKFLNNDRVLTAEAVPGRPMLDYITTVRENGKSVSISKELRNLLPLYRDLDKLTEDFTGLLYEIADVADESAFLRDTADELQNAARQKWNDGEEFLGLYPTDGGLGEFLAEEICGSGTNLTVRELADRWAELMGE